MGPCVSSAGPIGVGRRERGAGLRTFCVCSNTRYLMEATSSPDPRRWKALIVLSIAYLMVVLDTAIVGSATLTMAVSCTTFQ